MSIARMPAGAAQGIFRKTKPGGSTGHGVFPASLKELRVIYFPLRPLLSRETFFHLSFPSILFIESDCSVDRASFFLSLFSLAVAFRLER